MATPGGIKGIFSRSKSKTDKTKEEKKKAEKGILRSKSNNTSSSSGPICEESDFFMGKKVTPDCMPEECIRNFNSLDDNFGGVEPSSLKSSECQQAKSEKESVERCTGRWIQPSTEGQAEEYKTSGLASSFPRQVSSSSDFYSSVDQEARMRKMAQQEKIKKHFNEFTPELRVDYYDVMIMYANESDEDREKATEYRDHLNGIELDNGQKIKSVLYDDDELYGLEGTHFGHLEQAFERCTFAFVYLSKKFCEDMWCKLSSEECLMRTIYEPEKKWCVVPIYTTPRSKTPFRIPMGLNSLRGVNYYNNDEFYLRGIKKLIGDKTYKREKLQDELFEKRYATAVELEKAEIQREHEKKMQYERQQKELAEEKLKPKSSFKESSESNSVFSKGSGRSAVHAIHGKKSAETLVNPPIHFQPQPTVVVEEHHHHHHYSPSAEAETPRTLNIVGAKSVIIGDKGTIINAQTGSDDNSSESEDEHPTSAPQAPERKKNTKNNKGANSSQVHKQKPKINIDGASNVIIGKNETIIESQMSPPAGPLDSSEPDGARSSDSGDESPNTQKDYMSLNISGKQLPTDDLLQQEDVPEQQHYNIAPQSVMPNSLGPQQSVISVDMAASTNIGMGNPMQSLSQQSEVKCQTNHRTNAKCMSMVDEGNEDESILNFSNVPLEDEITVIKHQNTCSENMKEINKTPEVIFSNSNNLNSSQHEKAYSSPFDKKSNRPVRLPSKDNTKQNNVSAISSVSRPMLTNQHSSSDNEDEITNIKKQNQFTTSEPKESNSFQQTESIASQGKPKTSPFARRPVNLPSREKDVKPVCVASAIVRPMMATSSDSSSGEDTYRNELISRGRTNPKSVSDNSSDTQIKGVHTMATASENSDEETDPKTMLRNSTPETLHCDSPDTEMKGIPGKNSKSLNTTSAVVKGYVCDSPETEVKGFSNTEHFGEVNTPVVKGYCDSPDTELKAFVQNPVNNTQPNAIDSELKPIVHNNITNKVDGTINAQNTGVQLNLNSPVKTVDVHDTTSKTAGCMPNQHFQMNGTSCTKPQSSQKQFSKSDMVQDTSVKPKTDSSRSNPGKEDLETDGANSDTEDYQFVTKEEMEEPYLRLTKEDMCVQAVVTVNNMGFKQAQICQALQVLRKKRPGHVHFAVHDILDAINQDDLENDTSLDSNTGSSVDRPRPSKSKEKLMSDPKSETKKEKCSIS